MGAVTFSLDVRLVECLKEALPLSILVETGTFEGDTVATMAPFFDRLITVEVSEPLWKSARDRFKGESKVEAHLGNSPEALSRIRPVLGDASTLFWLDAHWCVAENTAGDESQCPLLAELSAIDRLGDTSVVLIDDARLFLAPPPEPHDVAQWPSFDQIVTALRRLSDQHELMVVNDVIAFYPRIVNGSMNAFARRYGVDWLRARQSLNENGDMLSALEEKEAAIQAHSQSLREKEALIRQLGKKVAVYRSAYSTLRYVIRPAKRVISAARSFAHQSRNVLGPRLGNLNQHAPRKLHLPPHYARSVHVTQPPSIAIVTPSFKQAGFIERTINSVLGQAYPNLEYHIQDGGSEDGTREILERYSDRLAGWESRADRGQAQAINLGFARTSGDIMAWLNSDDILLPGALAYVAAYFNKHPGIDVVYGHRILIDENDQEIGRWIMPAHDDEVLSWADYIPQETLFWRRRIWDKVGGRVDESFRFAMDWDLLVRFRAAGAAFHRLPRFLAAFRIHPQQKTSAEMSKIGFAEMNRIRERELGRRVTQGEIRKAVSLYLLRHLIHDHAYRIKRILGIAPQ